MLLVNVGDHEGYLRFAVVIDTVVATDGDEFARALHDESHSGLAVDVSEMFDFARTQVLVWIEIAQPNGLRREPAMESQQCSTVGRRDWPHQNLRAIIEVNV